eukprot:8797081-Prorocentrum_lima.AAC.1
MPVLNVDTLHRRNATRQQDSTEEQQVWVGMIAIRPRPTTASPIMHPTYSGSSANAISLKE